MSAVAHPPGFVAETVTLSDPLVLSVFAVLLAPFVAWILYIYFLNRSEKRREAENDDLRAQTAEAAFAAGAMPADRTPRCVRCGAREDAENDLVATQEGSMCELCYLEAK